MRVKRIRTIGLGTFKEIVMGTLLMFEDVEAVLVACKEHNKCSKSDSVLTDSLQGLVDSAVQFTAK